MKNIFLILRQWIVKPKNCIFLVCIVVVIFVFSFYFRKGPQDSGNYVIYNDVIFLEKGCANIVGDVSPSLFWFYSYSHDKDYVYYRCLDMRTESKSKPVTNQWIMIHNTRTDVLDIVGFDQDGFPEKIYFKAIEKQVLRCEVLIVLDDPTPCKPLPKDKVLFCKFDEALICEVFDATPSVFGARARSRAL